MKTCKVCGVSFTPYLNNKRKCWTCYIKAKQEWYAGLKTGNYEFICKRCKSKFKTHNKERVYCDACKADHEVNGYICICKTCGKEFRGNMPNCKYCKNPCQPNKSKPKPSPPPPPPPDDFSYYPKCVVCGGMATLGYQYLYVCGNCVPKSVYVYTWSEVGKSYPFYVGIGSCSRFHDLHTLGEGGPLAACERYRQAMGGYRVQILYEGLERPVALAIENLLIMYYRSIGVDLSNRTDEQLPLPLKDFELTPPDLTMYHYAAT